MIDHLCSKSRIHRDRADLEAAQGKVERDSKPGLLEHEGIGKPGAALRLSSTVELDILNSKTAKSILIEAERNSDHLHLAMQNQEKAALDVAKGEIQGLLKLSTKFQEDIYGVIGGVKPSRKADPIENDRLSAAMAAAEFSLGTAGCAYMLATQGMLSSAHQAHQSQIELVIRAAWIAYSAPRESVALMRGTLMLADEGVRQARPGLEAMMDDLARACIKRISNGRLILPIIRLHEHTHDVLGLTMRGRDDESRFDQFASTLMGVNAAIVLASRLMMDMAGNDDAAVEVESLALKHRHVLPLGPSWPMQMLATDAMGISGVPVMEIRRH